VGLVTDDDLFAAAAVGELSDEVAHRAAGDVKSGLFAEHFGGGGFEAVDGWVFAENVVADFGVRHGRAHGGAGFGDGIAAEVYGAHQVRLLVM
jgi:hypothetical protein